MKREDYRVYTERLMSSGMEVGTWCDLNGVKRATMYYWLKKFRDEEPELLGGYETAHAGDGDRRWFDKVRAAYCAERAIQLVPKAKPAEKTPASTAGFVLVGAAEIASDAPCSEEPRPCIAVTIGRATVEVPSGSVDHRSRRASRGGQGDARRPRRGRRPLPAGEGRAHRWPRMLT